MSTASIGNGALNYVPCSVEYQCSHIPYYEAVYKLMLTKSWFIIIIILMHTLYCIVTLRHVTFRTASSQ